MHDAEAEAKAEFLIEAMGRRGADTYHRIIDFMRPRSAAVIDGSAWYLSIVGVAPAAQGRGIGAQLIEATLAEADQAGVPCYLETFDGRNPRFYARLGFFAVASHLEPVTTSAYTLMVRTSRNRRASLPGSPSTKSLMIARPDSMHKLCRFAPQASRRAQARIFSDLAQEQAGTKVILFGNTTLGGLSCSNSYRGSAHASQTGV